MKAVTNTDTVGYGGCDPGDNYLGPEIAFRGYIAYNSWVPYTGSCGTYLVPSFSNALVLLLQILADALRLPFTSFSFILPRYHLLELGVCQFILLSARVQIDATQTIPAQCNLKVPRFDINCSTAQYSTILLVRISSTTTQLHK